DDGGAGDGGGDCVRGGVEGAGVDALDGPERQGDGEDAEEVRGFRGVGMVEPASAEQVHEPWGDRDHPRRNEQADGEEAGYGAAYRRRELYGKFALEERGEEWQGGGAGGG